MPNDPAASDSTADSNSTAPSSPHALLGVPDPASGRRALWSAPFDLRFSHPLCVLCKTREAPGHSNTSTSLQPGSLADPADPRETRGGGLSAGAGGSLTPKAARSARAASASVMFPGARVGSGSGPGGSHHAPDLTRTLLENYYSGGPAESQPSSPAGLPDPAAQARGSLGAAASDQTDPSAFAPHPRGSSEKQTSAGAGTDEGDETSGAVYFVRVSMETEGGVVRVCPPHPLPHLTLIPLVTPLPFPSPRLASLAPRFAAHPHPWF